MPSFEFGTALKRLSTNVSHNFKCVGVPIDPRESNEGGCLCFVVEGADGVVR